MTAKNETPRFAADAILDHIEFAVADAERSRRFYEEALRPFGMTVIIRVGPERTRTGGTRYGLGRDGYPRIWFHDGEGLGSPMHLALATAGRRVVDAFHAAALTAGGRDNGAPGIRERYHPNYYAAFILDPDGNNIEAVCQVPDGEVTPGP
ncbi:VOC family protein [Teichococcus vastitatis]|jgi:catechol 2,3-dioxygenase-like lactoylglutathione lyase family enzyme|uniref:VOC family protein n=1 Tax=Teichococcus vastitatis TaxID=2307076 RepID=A0ABS9W6Y4_9PROT|nr:VOC family protein [Pseudoroseomonas vastitatis]MCI0755041.1 VOC family protein [Pseudoroseomonas vastitatis]